MHRVAFALLAAMALQGGAQRSHNKQQVTFKSGDLTLAGYVFKPEGPGPFPLVVWNHGSEHTPGRGPQFDSVAAIFVPAGYAVIAPMRRGHSESQGTWITDQLDALRGTVAPRELGRTMVRLMETEQLDDQLAGLRYAKSLPFVDTTRMVVAGCSYGGIETLLAAERGAGLRAAYSISPAALSWNGNVALQDRLKASVGRISIPVRLIQPPEDASLGPARELGAEAKRLGKTTFAARVYPATMPEAERLHCFGGAKGMHNWGAEAVAFFDSVLTRKR